MEKENKIINEDDFKYANIKGLNPQHFRDNLKAFIDNINRKLKYFEKNSLLLIEGGKNPVRFDTDTNMYYFYQDPNFFYLTGINAIDFYGFLDFTTEELTVFMPNASEKERVYTRIPSYEEILQKYGIKCLDLADLYQTISFRNPKKLYRLKGTNSDSNHAVKTASFNPPEKYSNLSKLIDDNELIYEILSDTRTRKTQKEKNLISYVVEKTCEAHIETIKSIEPNKIEREVENVFKSFVNKNLYCRENSYSPIVGTGVNSGTLHYGKNDQTLKDGDLVLFDMGCRVAGYCSDITSTVPVNGKFTDKQKQIYNIVLKANRSVMEASKPGVYWPEMHLLAEKIILTELQKLGLLKSEFKVEDMLKDRLGYYFMPHGLGHFIGMDCHDVGGYLSFTPPRSDLPGLKQLRTSRYLQEGNLITIEPGCYFIPFLLDKAMNDNTLQKYLNKTLIRDEYYSFGGVRIEDNVYISKSGAENLSKSLPRTVEEIEKLMKN